MQNLPDKRYYSIGEVAEAFSVNTSLIRFWETQFPQLSPKKNARGARKFTPEDVALLKQIHHLVKEKGFTLDGAKTQLKKEKKHSMSTAELIDRLEGVKKELIAIRDQL
jgi:DNA-binding transcriptional MerR regulator